MKRRRSWFEITEAWRPIRADASCLRVLVLTAAALCAIPIILIAAFSWATVALSMCMGAAVLGVLARELNASAGLFERVERIALAHGASSQQGSRAHRALGYADAIGASLHALSLQTRRNAVTNLPTRAEFLAEIAEDFYGDTPTLLGVIRFANYQQIAAFDAQTAERVLAAFSQRLEAAVGRQRPLAHVDRDCFAVWFRGVASARQAAAELQAISYAVAREIKDGDLIIAPDVQVGSALHCDDDPLTLLTRATVSLARRSAAIAVPSERGAADARRRFSLEQDLRRAMRGNQLQLHYQPLVDLKQGRVVGAEALLRWRHPQLGSISPAEFVPILEESGLVNEIGLWTLNAACRQVRAWRDAGDVDLKIAVNLSAQQLRDPSLRKVIHSTLDHFALEPSCLELELTETAAMEDAEHTLRLFRDLKESGFGLAIDDFGAGYSSLSYLKKLPFSKLKIDREFVSHVDGRSSSRAICKALIELAAGLDITVLAEGVERREEVEELRRLGCSTFQGFYFSPPRTAAEFIETVRNPDWLYLLASPVHRERDHLQKRLSQ